MKKSKKIALIVATILVAVGLAVFFGAVAAMGFDFTKLNTVSLQTSTYEIEDAFHHIAIDEVGCDVNLYLSDDGTCKVICRDSEYITYTVHVNEDTLHIKQEDSRKWYQQINLSLGKSETAEIRIYLPESSYQSLDAALQSGDIVVPEAFCFESAKLRSSSGNIEIRALVNQSLDVKATSGDIWIANASPADLTAQSSSGDITLEAVNAEDNIRVDATSGDLYLSNVHAQAISASTTSGEIELADVLADESIRIESSSGDVALQRCDAEALHIQTSSGDVSGTLLTEKVFRTDTASGDVDVPQSTSGGECEIQTTSGDIVFR